MNMPGGRALVIAAGVLIAVTVVAALALTGLPGLQRQARLDERRVQDLVRLDTAIQAHARLHEALPDALGALDASTGRGLPQADPGTGQAYGYAAGEAGRYRLCAVFDTDSVESADGLTPEGWSHPAGHHCFQRRLDDAGALSVRPD